MSNENSPANMTVSEIGVLETLLAQCKLELPSLSPDQAQALQDRFMAMARLLARHADGEVLVRDDESAAFNDSALARLECLDALMNKYHQVVPALHPVQASALEERFIDLADLCALIVTGDPDDLHSFYVHGDAACS